MHNTRPLWEVRGDAGTTMSQSILISRSASVRAMMLIARSTAVVLCAAVMLATFGSDKVLSDVGEVVDFVTPKSSVEFIQEDKGCNCASATSKACSKFKGDMKKITSLKEKADARASKSETEAQKQAGTARRCLATEQLLSGDANL